VFYSLLSHEPQHETIVRLSKFFSWLKAFSNETILARDHDAIVKFVKSL
jgi:hypothetical protein